MGKGWYGIQGQESLLSFDIVLHGRAHTPRRISPQLCFITLQELHQWHPQTQNFHVVGIVKVLDELLKIVKGDELAVERDLWR